LLVFILFVLLLFFVVFNVSNFILEIYRLIALMP